MRNVKMSAGSMVGHNDKCRIQKAWKKHPRRRRHLSADGSRGHPQPLELTVSEPMVRNSIAGSVWWGTAVTTCWETWKIERAKKPMLSWVNSCSAHWTVWRVPVFKLWEKHSLFPFWSTRSWGRQRLCTLHSRKGLPCDLSADSLISLSASWMMCGEQFCHIFYCFTAIMTAYGRAGILIRCSSYTSGVLHTPDSNLSFPLRVRFLWKWHMWNHKQVTEL